jgi:dienelactone hydrolase
LFVWWLKSDIIGFLIRFKLESYKGEIMFRLMIAITVLMIASAAQAAIKLEKVEYKQADTTLVGWIAYDDAVSQPRPGIVVFPEWWGLNDYAKHRAEQLAGLGYVAFAADMYGDGKTTTDPKEAGEWSGKVHGDIELLRARAAAALGQLKASPHVDPKHLAAIGYCFGGTVALELALTGAELQAVVSFHGGLDMPGLDDAKNIKAKILVCTGGDDAFVPPAQVQKFEDAMRKGGVDWVVNTYGGAHHAFTNPDAGSFHMDNIAYSPTADKRSWAAMRELFDEVFGNQPGAENTMPTHDEN